MINSILMMSLSHRVPMLNPIIDLLVTIYQEQNPYILEETDKQQEQEAIGHEPFLDEINIFTLKLRD